MHFIQKHKLKLKSNNLFLLLSNNGKCHSTSLLSSKCFLYRNTLHKLAQLPNSFFSSLNLCPNNYTSKPKHFRHRTFHWRNKTRILI